MGGDRLTKIEEEAQDPGHQQADQQATGQRGCVLQVMARPSRLHFFGVVAKEALRQTACGGLRLKSN